MAAEKPAIETPSLSEILAETPPSQKKKLDEANKKFEEQKETLTKALDKALSADSWEGKLTELDAIKKTLDPYLADRLQEEFDIKMLQAWNEIAANGKLEPRDLKAWQAGRLLVAFEGITSIKAACPTIKKRGMPLLE